jgi:hypothetical protein
MLLARPKVENVSMVNILPGKVDKANISESLTDGGCILSVRMVRKDIKCIFIA